MHNCSRAFMLVGAVALPIVLAGCATQQEVDALRQDLKQTQEEVSALQSDLSAALKAVKDAQVAADQAMKAAAQAKMAEEKAQKIYAERNFEYPVKAGVTLHPMVASWGTFKADKVFLANVAQQRTLATKIMDRVRFDN